MSKERPGGQDQNYINQREQAKPQQDSPANTPTGEKKTETYSSGRTVFDCVVPRVRPDCLFLIRRMLQDTNLTKKEAQKLEQEWRESLRTMDRKTLEKELKESEKRWKRFNESHKRGGLTALGQALLPVLDEEMEVIQKALHRRFIEQEHN
jgi:hypothetical protein